MSYAHQVKGGRPLRLADHDPAEHGGLEKTRAAELSRDLGEELSELLDLLFYAGRSALLVVLQGRDTAGKDGVARHLLKRTQVQSARVEPFKAPTPQELAHDFLWRIHSRTPARGEIAIFNRSHYEDVLVVRVHRLAPEEIWRPRFAHINEFEKLLVDAGTIVLKFYMHISKEEQEQRLLEREKEPQKAWKLSLNDWKERQHWDPYTEAYEEALSRCSAENRPWFIVPSNSKWFRDLAVIEAIVEALRPHRKAWLEHLERIGIAARRELDAFRQERSS